MSEHPTPAELEAFVKGSLSPGRFRAIARHLVRGCSSCKALLISHSEAPPSSEPPPGGSMLSEESPDRAFSVLRSYRRYLRREEIRQREITSCLEKRGGLEVLRDKTEIPLCGLGTLKALLARSWTIRHESPKEMVNLARFAVNISRRLDPHWHDEREAADWQARAWGELGNALRVSDDLDEAERCFGFAFELFLQGTGNIHLKAKLYDLHASFLGACRETAISSGLG